MEERRGGRKGERGEREEGGRRDGVAMCIMRVGVCAYLLFLYADSMIACPHPQRTHTHTFRYEHTHMVYLAPTRTCFSVLSATNIVRDSSRTQLSYLDER
jgi:hypothetical protein